MFKNLKWYQRKKNKDTAKDLYLFYIIKIFLEC